MISLAPTILEWDSRNRKQIDEVKKFYISAKKQGRKILDIAGNLIEKFSPDLEYIKIDGPELTLDQISVRVVNDKGDERLIWNLLNKKEAEEAAERFQKYLDKGWKAYAVDEQGRLGQRIFNFDPKLEEISLTDKSIKMRLKDFAKTFRKIEVLPKNIQG